MAESKTGKGGARRGQTRWQDAAKDKDPRRVLRKPRPRQRRPLPKPRSAGGLRGNVCAPHGLRATAEETLRRGRAAAPHEQFGYKNRFEVPGIEKIVLNMGVGEAVNDTKKVTLAARTSP